VAIVFLIPILLFVLYGWSTLTFSYGHGERSGYVQKFAKEGWVCKTWEGELARHHAADLPLHSARRGGGETNRTEHGQARIAHLRGAPRGAHIVLWRHGVLRNLRSDWAMTAGRRCPHAVLLA